MKRTLVLFLLCFVLITILPGQELLVINRTGFNIFKINISPSLTENWSGNLIPDSVIMNGESFRIITEDYASGGMIDVRLIDAEGYIYLKRQVEAEEGKKIVFTVDDLLEINAADTEAWVITLVNRTDDPVIEIYITGEMDNAWGAERLAGTILYPGSEIKLILDRDEPVGVRYILKIVMMNKNKEKIIITKNLYLYPDVIIPLK